jgi:hypothetical protein
MFMKMSTRSTGLPYRADADLSFIFEDERWCYYLLRDAPRVLPVAKSFISSCLLILFTVDIRGAQVFQKPKSHVAFETPEW